MGPKVKKAFSDAYDEAKRFPKALWFAALVLPGGIVITTIYLVGKTAYNNLNKKEKEQ